MTQKHHPVDVASSLLNINSGPRLISYSEVYPVNQKCLPNALIL